MIICLYASASIFKYVAFKYNFTVQWSFPVLCFNWVPCNVRRDQVSCEGSEWDSCILNWLGEFCMHIHSAVLFCWYAAICCTQALEHSCHQFNAQRALFIHRAHAYLYLRAGLAATSPILNWRGQRVKHLVGVHMTEHLQSVS